MSTRSLSDHEIVDLLNQHPDIDAVVLSHEQMFLVDGHPYQWDQTLIAAQGDTTYAVPVPIPPRGLALQNDPTYGNVVIFPDAAGVLHFIATDNTSLVSEIEKPVYASDPDYWQLFEQLAKNFHEALPSIPQIEFGVGALAVSLVAVLLLVHR
jgi:hypothetical protein